MAKKKVKGTWGGARERKVKKEPTKVKRVPIAILEKLEELIAKHKSKFINHI